MQASGKPDVGDARLSLGPRTRIQAARPSTTSATEQPARSLLPNQTTLHDCSRSTRSNRTLRFSHLHHARGEWTHHRVAGDKTLDS